MPPVSSFRILTGLGQPFTESTDWSLTRTSDFLSSGAHESVLLPGPRGIPRGPLCVSAQETRPLTGNFDRPAECV